MVGRGGFNFGVLAAGGWSWVFSSTARGCVAILIVFGQRSLSRLALGSARIHGGVGFSVGKVIQSNRMTDLVCENVAPIKPALIIAVD